MWDTVSMLFKVLLPRCARVAGNNFLSTNNCSYDLSKIAHRAALKSSRLF